MPRFYDTCAGPIGGLYLPPVAWDVLQREKIQTLEQLVDIADRLEQVEGIEPRMAEVIREVVARNRIEATEISDVVLGCVNQAGEDCRNVACSST